MSIVTKEKDWISAKDSLPDDDLIVLVNVPSASEPVWLGFISWEGYERWHWADGSVIYGIVTHWQELPEAPR